MLASHEEMKAVVDSKLCLNTASSHSAVVDGSVPIVTQLELDLQLRAQSLESNISLPIIAYDCIVRNE